MNKTLPPTLDELAALRREYLKTSEVAAVLGVTLYAPVIMARHKQFPFDVPSVATARNSPSASFWSTWAGNRRPAVGCPNSSRPLSRPTPDPL